MQIAHLLSLSVFVLVGYIGSSIRAQLPSAGSSSQITMMHSSDSTLRVDSSGPSSRNFFDQEALETQTCKPGYGMVRVGNLGISALPWPCYREGYGWDLGAESYVGFGAKSESGAFLVWGLFSAYNEREDRGVLSTIVTPRWHRGDVWEFDTPVGIITRPGRGGFGGKARLTYSWPEDSGTLSVIVRFVSEKFTQLNALSEQRWTAGRHRWAEFNLGVWDFHGTFLDNIRLSATARTSLQWFGSDFDYRQAQIDLAWAKPHATVWAATGVSDGNQPYQERFDLATDGQIKGLPIWESRPDDFLAIGVETRVHFASEVFAGAYGTVAAGHGMEHAITELGVALVDAYDKENSDPHDWFIRLDFPLYMSESERFSSRSKWDARRFMFRVNLPLSDITGDEITRYRYPNR